MRLFLPVLAAAAILALPALVAPASAQPSPAPSGPSAGGTPDAFSGATLDLVGRYEHLSAEFDPSRTLGAAFVVPGGRAAWWRAAWWRAAWWRADLVAGQHLGEPGVLYALAHTRDLHPRVYVSAAVAGSSGEALALPRARVDAMAYARLGRTKRVVVGAGGFYHVAHDEHRDRGALAEVQWYVRDGLTLQAGGRVMRSNPGNAPGRHIYASATLGRQGRRFVAARVGASHEAYQVLRPLDTYADFDSREASLTWREWTGRRSGVTAAVSVYHSPYFTRTGVTLGAFRTLR